MIRLENVQMDIDLFVEIQSVYEDEKMIPKNLLLRIMFQELYN